MFTEKQVFINELYMSRLPLSMKWKHTDSPVKETIPGAAVILKDIRNTKGFIIINLLGKIATLNRVSYCQLLRQNSHNLLNDPRMYEQKRRDYKIL